MTNSDKFTFIHVAKCGGSFIRYVANLSTGEQKYKTSHTTRLNLNNNKPFVSSVRNPFDWYVSFYHHCIKVHNPVARGIGDFNTTITTLLNLKGSEKQKELIAFDWGGMKPETGTPYMSGLCTQDFLDYPNDVGYFSWLWHRMLSDENGNTDDVDIIKVETLEDDLIGIFNKFGGITEANKELIKSTPKVNVGVRGDYRGYYDDELIAMVYKKDKAIFDRFGYEF